VRCHVHNSTPEQLEENGHLNGWDAERHSEDTETEFMENGHIKTTFVLHLERFK